MSKSKKKKKNNNVKKHEFSKLILIVAAAINIIVIGFTLFVVVRTSDTSPLAYLIPSVGAEVATSTSFYFNKAKRENEIKILKSNGIPINAENINGGM